MSKFHAAIFLCLTAVFAPQCHAERADRDKPMNAEADALRYDDLRRITVLAGNAIITKGTIVMRANRIQVNEDPDGFQKAVAGGEPGKRVFFRQKRDGVDEFIEAEADSMVYDERADTVTFSRNAILKRYRGSTLFDETAGTVISYDNKTESFSVDGGSVAQGNTTSNGRVRAVLTPRPSASAAPGSPARLRPSGALQTPPN
jgi:lipopolysaccharide export system protein LptA